MARKKMIKTKRRSVSKRQPSKIVQINDYMRKPEFWIGLATIFVVVVIGTLLVSHAKFLAVKTHTEKFISPVPTNVAISVTPTGTVENITPSQRVTVTPTPENSQMLSKKVGVLANTDGNYEYTVVNGDNFYKISKNICGTGKYFRSIQAYNRFDDSMKLHSGDIIEVICSN